MLNFSDAIPEEVLRTPNVRRFVKVLDELNIYKRNVVEQMDTAFSFVRLNNQHFLRKFFYELGNMEWVEGMPLHLYKQFIAHAWEIFHYKGSRKGLQLLCKNLMDADVETNMDELFPLTFLTPDDLELGLLPNGADLGNAGTTAFLYLFDGNVSDYYGACEIRLIGPYFHVPEFRNFVAAILPDFLCMADTRTTDIVIKFYGSGQIHSYSEFLLNEPNI